jgi:N-acetylneuraminate lyase
MKLTRPLHELIAATFSPFHADGSIAPEAVPIQACFLAAQGIRTVFVTGTTGECSSLTCDERLALYDAWGEAGCAHDLAVIAHVGSNSITDARNLASRAGELGLAAISAFAPSYFKPTDLETLIDWCAAIAAAAPDLPFYYYDIPELTDVSLPVERFLVEAADRIPNLAGVKFTNADLVSYRRSLDVAGQRFDLP